MPAISSKIRPDIGHPGKLFLSIRPKIPKWIKIAAIIDSTSKKPILTPEIFQQYSVQLENRLSFRSSGSSSGRHFRQNAIAYPNRAKFQFSNQ